jgi:hypothetical protein
VVPDIIYDDQCFARQPLDTWYPDRLVGWRAVIWNRALSDNCWRKGSEVHGRDIVVENPHNSAFMAQHGDGIAGNSMIMDSLPSCPTLSIHGDDLVHMDILAAKQHMISIDMRNKTLKTFAPFPPAVKSNAYAPYFPSVLSNYLNNTSVRLGRPQKSIGYYESHHEHADCTDPSYGQQSNPLQQQPQQTPAYRPNWPQQQPTYRPNWQQPTFRPNWRHIPSWTSPPVNAQPAYQVVSTTAFTPMVHPFPLNDYRMFQPPPPWAHVPPLPFNGMYIDASTSISGSQPCPRPQAQEPTSTPILWTVPLNFIFHP